MTDLRIRPALRHEISEIEEIGVAAYAVYRSETPAAIFDAYMADLRNLAAYWGEAEVLVAELGGRVGGSVMFYPDASTEGLGLPKEWAGFRKLAVKPQLQGEGLGRRLIDHCIRLAQARGAAAIGIHTGYFMTAARHIYEQLGFKRCPEFDLRAADIFGNDEIGQLDVIAYRFDLKGNG